jgi:hypothetical protein
VVVLASVGGLVAATIAGVVGGTDGRWTYPRRGFSETTSSAVAGLPDPPGRVLWVGDQRVLPLDGWELDDGTHFSVTASGRPDATNRWVVDDAGMTEVVGQHLDLAARGDTVRLGRLLAVYGIDLVVVTTQLAPAPYDGATFDPGEVGSALAGQLDLERLAGAPDLVIYRNTASQGAAVGLSDELLAKAGRDEAAELLDVSFDDATRVDVTLEGASAWSGEVPDGEAVLLAVTDDGRWEVAGARTAGAAGFGGLLVLEPGPGGQVTVDHPTPLNRRLLLLGQFGLVALGWAIAQWRREELVADP